LLARISASLRPGNVALAYELKILGAKIVCLQKDI
jgi:hypothetical protein